MARKWNVRIDAEVVAVPREIAAELLPDLQSDDAQRFVKATDTIQNLIRNKQAELVAWPTLTTHSAERAVAESIDEKRYPTGNEPINFAPPRPSGGAVDAQLTAASAEFETRNIGITFEVEPVVVQDGARIALNMVLQHTDFAGMEKFESTRTVDGRGSAPDQPQFGVIKTTTSLTLKSGARILLSAAPSRRQGSPWEIVLLRAVAERVD